LNVKYSVNHFADLTNDEFRSMYLGYKGVSNRVKNYVDESDVQVADSVDWVAKGAVTPVKD
jgi:cathepsin L